MWTFFLSHGLEYRPRSIFDFWSRKDIFMWFVLLWLCQSNLSTEVIWFMVLEARAWPQQRASVFRLCWKMEEEQERDRWRRKSQVHFYSKSILMITNPLYRTLIHLKGQIPRDLTTSYQPPPPNIAAFRIKFSTNQLWWTRSNHSI